MCRVCLTCASVLACVSGQSVHLGMGGSWSRAVPRHLWTLRHILPGLLYLLLHWRVNHPCCFVLFLVCTWSHVARSTVFCSLDESVYSCLLILTSPFKGLCGHSALWKDQLRETPGKVRALLLTTHTNWYTEGKHTRAHTF